MDRAGARYRQRMSLGARHPPNLAAVRSLWVLLRSHRLQVCVTLLPRILEPANDLEVVDEAAVSQSLIKVKTLDAGESHIIADDRAKDVVRLAAAIDVNIIVGRIDAPGEAAIAS